MLTPPTDNLYKFLAIAGLALIALSVTVLFGARDRLFARQDQFALEEAAAIGDRIAHQAQLEILADAKIAVADGDAKLKRAQGRIERGGGSRQSVATATVELDRAKAALYAAKTKAAESAKATRVSDAKVQITRAVEVRLGKEARSYGWWASVGCFVGTFVSSIGFIFWYFQLQRYEDAVVAAASKKVPGESEPAPPRTSRRIRTERR